MAKDLGGLLKSFAGNLGGPMSGLGQIGGPMSGLGIMKNLMGGGDDEDGDEEANPGQKMFGMNADNRKEGGFFSKFGSNLSDQLFQRAMMGFMGRGN
jgi:hypothetical protein